MKKVNGTYGPNSWNTNGHNLNNGPVCLRAFKGQYEIIHNSITSRIVRLVMQSLTKPNQTKPNQNKSKQTKPKQTKTNTGIVIVVKKELAHGFRAYRVGNSPVY